MKLSEKIKKLLELIFSRYEYNNIAVAEDLSLLSIGELRSRFYRNGFIYGKFNDVGKARKLIEKMENVLCKSKEDSHLWVKKYRNSLDLRPSFAEAFPESADLFLDLGPIDLARKASGRTVFAGHSQLRKSEASSRTYNGWHRDTHFYSSGQAGNVPPAIKIIIFPKLKNASEVCLNVIPGSHLAEGKSWFIDFLKCIFGKKIAIENSDENFLIFDAALFHSAMVVRKNIYTPRAIYSLVEKFQLSQFGKLEKNIFYNAHLKNLKRKNL